jgi:hypothetical protein
MDFVETEALLVKAVLGLVGRRANQEAEKEKREAKAQSGRASRSQG